MPLYTNLDMVQNILSAMDSDEVNSISDTIEADQVFEIIKETYYEMLDRREWKFLERTRRLENVNNSATPNKLKIPDRVYKIDTFRYRTDDVDDTKQTWKDIKWLEPREFLHKVQSMDSSDSLYTTVANDDNINMYIRNDVAPSYFTTFDDEYIWTDSWDSELETTLNESRSAIECLQEPVFQTGDTGVQDLPAQVFTYLLEESKATAFANLKQIANNKAEQRARRAWNRLREQHDRVDRKRSFVNYGR